LAQGAQDSSQQHIDGHRTSRVAVAPHETTSTSRALDAANPDVLRRDPMVPQARRSASSCGPRPNSAAMTSSVFTEPRNPVVGADGHVAAVEVGAEGFRRWYAAILRQPDGLLRPDPTVTGRQSLDPTRRSAALGLAEVAIDGDLVLDVDAADVLDLALAAGGARSSGVELTAEVADPVRRRLAPVVDEVVAATTRGASSAAWRAWFALAQWPAPLRARRRADRTTGHRRAAGCGRTATPVGRLVGVGTGHDHPARDA